MLMSRTTLSGKNKVFSMASDALQNPHLGEFSEKGFYWAFQMPPL